MCLGTLEVIVPRRAQLPPALMGVKRVILYPHLVHRVKASLPSAYHGRVPMHTTSRHACESPCLPSTRPFSKPAHRPPPTACSPYQTGR